MNLLDIIKPSDDEREWLASEFLRRAALLYEASEMWHDAADCWSEVGDASRAAELYLRSDDYSCAAPLLVSSGRYSEALDCYRKWLDSLSSGDVVNHVRVQLGISACLTQMQTDTESAQEMYRSARVLIESALHHHPLSAGHCWEALGEYGVTVGRSDLTVLGYEQALTCYGEQYHMERMRAARAYLSAIHGNRTLAGQIEAQMADWTPRRIGRIITPLSFEELRQRAEQIRELRLLEGHSNTVWCVSFSPDGQLLASGSWDKTIRLWDVGTGGQVRTLEGHTAVARSVSFSPDGQLLASGAGDRTVRLWDISALDVGPKAIATGFTQPVI